MLKIGVTGGIGSGKTTVCNIFQFLGIPVYNADIRAKELMTENSDLRQKIKKLLGSESYISDEKLNRKYIAKIIFNDRKKLKKINNLVHPVVKTDFEKWTKEQNSPYILKEAALLFETGSYKDLDRTILVTAPLEIRIKRVILRDKIDKENVMSRIENQLPDEFKVRLADHIIINDGKHSLINQIIKLDKKFKSK